MWYVLWYMCNQAEHKRLKTQTSPQLPAKLREGYYSSSSAFYYNFFYIKSNIIGSNSQQLDFYANIYLRKSPIPLEG